MHLARLIKDAGGIRLTATSAQNGTPDAGSTSRTPNTADRPPPSATAAWKANAITEPGSADIT
jgi:hypothetical protein